MEEILKDKTFWTKEKFREKEEDCEKDDNLTDEKKYTTSDNKLNTTDSKVQENDNSEDEISKNPEEVDAYTAIENKVIGLFFAAKWCCPSQEFTSLLKDVYEELQERTSPFEIIFISFDKKYEDMKEYFTEKQGGWLAVPYKDTLVDTLKAKYDIKAIPKLVIIRENGTVITEKGRKDIQDKGVICFRGWHQKANLTATKRSEKSSSDPSKEIDKEKTVTFDDKISSFNS